MAEATTTITRDTKVTIGVLIACATAVLLPAVGTYLSVTNSLYEVRLELQTGFTGLRADVQHLKETVQASTVNITQLESRVDKLELRMTKMEK